MPFAASDSQAQARNVAFVQGLQQLGFFIALPLNEARCASLAEYRRAQPNCGVECNERVGCWPFSETAGPAPCLTRSMYIGSPIQHSRGFPGHSTTGKILWLRYDRPMSLKEKILFHES
jgi:hypothetical protein